MKKRYRHIFSLLTMLLISGSFLQMESTLAGHEEPEKTPPVFDRIQPVDRDLPYEHIQVALLDSGVREKYSSISQILDQILDTQKSFISSNQDDSGSDHRAHASRILDHLTLYGDVRPAVQDLQVIPDFGAPRSGDVIAAMDWLLQRSDEHQPHIALINSTFTIPTSGEKSAFHTAVQKLRETGTTVIVPAGDDARNIRTKDSEVLPAAYTEVLTFSALHHVTSSSPDQPHPEPRSKLTEYSNYGQEVDFTDHLLKSQPQGTSFSAVTGGFAAMHYIAEALYKGAEEKITPSLIQQAMEAQAHQPEEGWANDPDGSTEPLVNPQTDYQRPFNSSTRRALNE